MIQAIAVKAIAFLTLKPPKCMSQRAAVVAYQNVLEIVPDPYQQVN